jgi:hypothetical protein
VITDLQFLFLLPHFAFWQIRLSSSLKRVYHGKISFYRRDGHQRRAFTFMAKATGSTRGGQASLGNAIVNPTRFSSTLFLWIAEDLSFRLSFYKFTDVSCLYSKLLDFSLLRSFYLAPIDNFQFHPPYFV